MQRFSGFLVGVFAVCITVNSVSAEIMVNRISNGDFETGDFTDWTIFLTDNGALGTPAVVSFDTNNDTVPTNSARFQAGQAAREEDVNRGGGIFQTITTIAGTLTLSADIAAVGSSVINGGRFELWLDDTIVDTQEFSGILNGTRYSSLGYVADVGAGDHEVRIQITRPYTEAPFQYVDNVAAMQVPEPASIFLLGGMGLMGMAVAARRRRRNK